MPGATGASAFTRTASLRPAGIGRNAEQLGFAFVRIGADPLSDAHDDSKEACIVMIYTQRWN